MQKLDLTIENARAAHKGADQKGKKLLEDLLGKETFVPVNIIDRVKSFEDACEVLDVDPDDTLPFGSDTDSPRQINVNAYAKLMIIAEVLNEGWKPDFSNSGQYKYYPYFTSLGSGLGLSYGGCAYDGSSSDVGSRLYYATAELAKYAGTQFIEIYNQFNN